MSCPQVGCKLKKISENQAVCLKNGCVFRLEKQHNIDSNSEGIFVVLLIAVLVVIIVAATGCQPVQVKDKLPFKSVETSQLS